MDQLDSFPAIDAFYERYWNKAPFVVKGWLAAEELASLADGNTLMDMAMMPEIDSKLVTAPSLATKDQSHGWSVEDGPFEDDVIAMLQQPRQSLLVQGVDHHHIPTARLWQKIAVSPLWLRDNIMASYSTHGGTVGPHVDSYHVFLLQGFGKRQWQVAASEDSDPTLIDGLPLKILADAFAGQTYVCEPGDVLYIPPGYCHHGVSIETAITYSLGFLGPDTTELWQSFGEYMDVIGEADDGQLKCRYRGGGLGRADSGFRISPATIAEFKRQMASALEHPLFNDWLGEYFSTGQYPDVDNEEEAAEYASADEQAEESYARAAVFTDKVLAGRQGLRTVFPFKVAITNDRDGQLSYQVAGLSVKLNVTEWQVIHRLLQLEPVSKAKLAETLDPAEPSSDLWPLLLHLWEEGFLAFE